MAVCQTSDYQRNSGLGFSISCVAAPACTLARKRITGVLSRPSYGLTALGPNGDCCQPNTGTGTASTNRFARWTDQGVWAQMHQHCCDDADLEYLIIDSTVVRAHPCAAGAPPQKGWPGGPGPGPEPRRVQHQDSRERGRLGQPLAIHPDRRATARHHPGGGVNRRFMLASTYWPTKGTMPRSFASTSWNWV